MILDVKDYIAKLNNQLENNLLYQRFKKGPINNANNVNTPIEKIKKQIFLTNWTAKTIIIEGIRTPLFHILQKFHKSDISGRPVVSSVKWHASKTLKFIYHYFRYMQMCYFHT